MVVVCVMCYCYVNTVQGMYALCSKPGQQQSLVCSICKVVLIPAINNLFNFWSFHKGTLMLPDSVCVSSI